MGILYVYMCACLCVCVKNQSLAFMRKGMLPNKYAYKFLFIENVTIIATLKNQCLFNYFLQAVSCIAA